MIQHSWSYCALCHDVRLRCVDNTRVLHSILNFVLSFRFSTLDSTGCQYKRTCGLEKARLDASSMIFMAEIYSGKRTSELLSRRDVLTFFCALSSLPCLRRCLCSSCLFPLSP